MNKEEIKDYLKRVDELELKLSGEDKDTYQWLLFGYNECARLLNEKEQENNQLKLDSELYKDNHIYKNYDVERKDIVIKELKIWLEEQYLRSDDYSDYETAFKMVLNKLNELEANND